MADQRNDGNEQWPDSWRQDADQRARAQGFADYEDWSRDWLEKANAEARAKGFADYEALVRANDERRRAKAAEPVGYDWREDTR